LLLKLVNIFLLQILKAVQHRRIVTSDGGEAAQFGRAVTCSGEDGMNFYG
jgi:hypothetical protein